MDKGIESFVKEREKAINSSRLSLHVHDDIEEGAKWFKIPLSLWNREYVYIMQEDRCVFVGNREDARRFYEKNDGEYCRSRFPE